jgi:1-acyl-sn-glycerol-3-phosphate acyltransferase
VRGYIALFVDSIQVEGRRFLPSGPKIVVANHANVTDGFMLPFIIQEKVHFLIQEETFELPFLGRMLTLADQIPVVIGQGRKALDIAMDKLALGHAIAIFPEGKLNHGEDMRRAGAGATMLALKSGAPLVPVGFYVPPKFIHLFKLGGFHDRESTGGWQFGGKCFVQIGEPWYPNLLQESENYRKLRELTDSLMTSVGNLVQQAKETAQSYYLE